MLPIVNLHNDLIGCIEFNESKWNFHSRALRCSLPQLIEGNIKFEILVIGTITTPDAVKKAKRQLELYTQLLTNCSKEIESFQNPQLTSNKIQTLLAVENASSLGDESDSFETIIERFEAIRRLEKVLYVSLTWNHENVFGGGNASNIGLKPYGKEFLLYLDQKNIAIDFSHTSDALAHDILNFIEQKNLNIPLIASHSNLRAICDVKRNLPDEIAKELYSKKAIMGLNFVRYFVGKTPGELIKHIEHAIKLGGEDALALGADFFDGFEVPSHLKSKYGAPYFFEELGDASRYPYFIEMIKPHFSEELIKKIAYQNALGFIEKYIPAQELLSQKS